MKVRRSSGQQHFRFSPAFEASIIEFVTVATALLLLAALAVPALLLMHPDSDPVNRLVDACQHGLRRGSLGVAGMVVAGLVFGWALFTVVRIGLQGYREYRNIARRAAWLNPVSRPVEFWLGGRSIRARVLLRAASRETFTAGLLRPQIYLGQSLVDSLTDGEREAVILHEASHVQNRDPLRCWLVHLILSSVLWPRCACLVSLHRALREATADRACLAAMDDDRPLLRAIAKADIGAAQPGFCALTENRTQAFRDFRVAGVRIPRRRALAIALALTLITMLVIFSAVGLSDWQAYWLCPPTTPKPL